MLVKNCVENIATSGCKVSSFFAAFKAFLLDFFLNFRMTYNRSSWWNVFTEILIIFLFSFFLYLLRMNSFWYVTFRNFYFEFWSYKNGLFSLLMIISEFYYWWLKIHIQYLDKKIIYVLDELFFLKTNTLSSMCKRGLLSEYVQDL